MPRYITGGETYDIPKEEISAFEAQYPDATIELYDGEDTYDIPLTKKQEFIERYPNASTTPPQKMETLTPSPTLMEQTAFEQGWGKSAMPIEEMPAPQSQPHPDSTIAQVRKEIEAEKQAKINALPTPETDKIVAEMKGFTTPSQNAYQQKMGEMDEINKAEKYGAITSQEADIKRKSEMIGDALSMANKPSDATMRRVNAEQVSKRLDDIEKSLDKRKNEVAFSSLDKYGDNAAYMMTAYSPIVERRSDKEYNTLLAAKRALSDAQSIIDEADRHINPDDYSKWQKNWLNGLGRGIGNGLFDVRTWDMGINEMSDASVLYQALDKADKGEELTEAEKALLDAKALEMATNAYFGSYLGRAYKAGQVTAQSVPFMLEMAINPLSAVGKTAQNKLVRYAIKEFGGKAINSKLKKTALKYGTRLAGDLAGAAGMTLSSSMPRTAADAFGRISGDIIPTYDNRGVASYGGHEGQVSAGKAIRQAITAGTLERFSEMMGYYFAPMTKALGKGATKMMEAPKLAKVNDFLGKVSSTDLARGMKDFHRATRWDGSISEYLEEVANNHLNALLVGDMEFNAGDKGVYNLDTNIDTFLGVSILGGGMSTITTAYYPVYKYRQHRALVNADRNAGRAFGGEWEGVKSHLVKIDDSIKQPIADILQSDEYTPEQKGAVLRYVKAKATLKGMQEADVNKLTDIEIPAEQKEIAMSYDVGRSLTTTEDMQDAEMEYQAAANKLREMFMLGKNGDVDTLLGENAVDDILESLEIGGSMEEAQAKLDYLNAKAKRDGMMDNIKDQAREQINAANEQIALNVNKESGTIQHALVRDGGEGRSVFIVSGDVKLLDDGSIDLENSSHDIIVRDEQTGKLEMSTPDKLASAQVAQDVNEFTQQVDNDIRERVAAEASNKINGTLPMENGDVYNIADEKGTPHQATVMNNNGDGSALVSIDGAEAVNMPTESIQAMADAYRIAQRAETKAQQEQAEREAFEEMDREASEQEAQAKAKEQEITQPATSSIPVDENGNRQYTQVDADTAWNGLMEQTEGDAEMAMIVANAMKSKAEKTLEKVKKEEVAKGNTPEEMISAMKAHKEKVAKAQAEVDKWNDIATTPQRRAEQARLDAEKEANAAKMQAIINDAVEKKAEQEQAETTPEVQEQDVQNEGEAQNNAEEVAEPAPQKPSPKEVKKAKALIKRINDWAKVLNVEPVIYNSVEEVESPQARKNIKEGKLVTGWYENGKIYFYLPNLRDVSDVNYTAIHETVAHHGMEAMLGKEAYRDLCKRIYDEVMTDAQRKDFLDYVRKNEPVKGGATEGKATYEEKIAIGDEFMAFLAEETYVEHSSAYDKIASFIRKALRAVGLDVKLSGEELRELLRESYQNLESGKAEATTGEHRARISTAETNPYLGRSLTSQEAKAVVSLMEDKAQAAPTLELTPDNWVAEFGEDGIVATPIGDVKMGEHQYLKLLQRKRSEYFGLIKPTLTDADIILEEYDPKEGAERDTKLLFVKTFIKEDGSRYIHFESVTVQKQSKEVSISSHEINAIDLQKKMHNDKVVHLKDSFLDSELRLIEPQVEGSDIVPTPNASSASKDTTSEPQMQEKAEENAESTEKNIEEVTESANRIEEEGGQVDVDRGDVRFAVRDVLIGEKKEQAIKDIMRVTGRSRKTVLKYLKAEESLANIILNGDNEQFLDLQVDESVPSIWENSDYPQGTVEFSNICRKRLPFTMIYQQLQKDYPNTVFDASTLESIRGVLKDNGIEVACGLCFVEDRRQHLGEIGQGFIDALNGKEITNEGQKEAIARVKASGDSYIPNLYELLTLDGMKELRREHPEIANAFIRYNSARGQGAGRLFQAYSAYHREILDYDQKRVNKINNSGGLRIFSFSDFEAHHLIDLVQVLTDCAAKGVKVQGYTKVPEFAYAVKDTKMKLNRSLIAKDSGIVDADYVPQQGEAVSPNVIGGKRLLLDTVEGIDVNHKDFFDSSSSKNVGNILVGINDEQIRLAMADPFVDYIIPFHTGIKKDVLKKKGIDTWKNYKLEQIEHIRKVDGTESNADKHGINIHAEVLSDDIKTEKQFVEKYLEVCKEKGWLPKFHRFLEQDKNGEFKYTKGYYKLLLDFKLFDKRGRILPQEVVEPIFDNEFNKQILEDYVAGEKVKAPNAEIYEQVKEALADEGKIRFSVRGNKEIEQIIAEAKSNGTYLKAPNGADTNLTPKQWAMVRTKAFKNWFGDWEKAARIEKLRNSKSISISGYEIVITDDFKLNKSNAIEYGKTLTGNYVNKDTGKEVRLTSSKKNGGLYEILQHNYKDVEHIQSIAAIPQIIEESIYIDTISNEDMTKHPNVLSYDYYVCGLNIGGEEYTVKAVVSNMSDGSRYYDHKLTNIEKARLIDMINKAPESSVSISTQTPESSAFSKSKDKRLELIIQTNSSKIVDANGEPKVVYHQTNATQYINVETGENWDDLDWRAKMEWDERDDWDEHWQEQDFNEFSRVNARVTNEFDGFFFAPEYDEYHEYGKRTIEAFLNIRKPASNADYNIDSTKNEAGREERIRLQGEGYDGVIREYDGVVDEYIAFEPNQIKSATDNVGAFDAGNNDIRFRFIGEKGASNLDAAEEATTRLDNLAIARQMEEANKDVKTIKMATGWERGADGLWRYEVEDEITAKIIRGLKGVGVKKIHEARSKRIKDLDKYAYILNVVGIDRLYNDNDIQATSWSDAQKQNWLDIYNTYKDDREKAIEHYRKLRSEISKLTSFGKGEFMLYEALGEDHPLFKEYPQMRDIKLLVKPYKGGTYMGGFNRLSNTIEIVDFRGIFENDKGEGTANTLAHEIQHIIQGVEGFARGGNASMEDPRKAATVKAQTAEYEESLHEDEAELRSLYQHQEDINLQMKSWWDAHPEANWEEALSDKSMEDLNNQYMETQTKINDTRERVSRYRSIIEEMESVDTTLGLEGYKRLAGEVEARNVERRRNMSMAERRSSLASETEDVARQDQIFLENALGENSIRFRIADYKAKFNNLQSEYDALDKNDAVALNAWRDKKVGVVRGYLESVAQRFGMKPKIVVFNGADEAQMQEAYQRLVESYKRTGNTPPTYEEFKEHCLDDKVFATYYKQGDMLVENISTKDKNNKKAKYGVNLFHENAHHHAHILYNEAELGSIWNEVAETTIPIVEKIKTSKYYKNKSDASKGNEFLAHSIGTLVRKYKPTFLQFVKGEIDVEDVTNKLEYKQRKVNFALAEILNQIKDEYQEARRNDSSTIMGGIGNGGLDRVSRRSVRSNVSERGRGTDRGGRSGSGLLVTPEQKAFFDAVAQNGFAKTVGYGSYDAFLDKAYRVVPKNVRDEITDRAKRIGWDFRAATQEYLASLAENNNQEAVDAIRKPFEEMTRKANISESFSDNDLRYMLWRNNQMQNSKGAIAVAEDVVMKQKLGVGNYEVADQTPSSPKFRIAMPHNIRDEFGKRVNVGDGKLKMTAYNFQEAFQDEMLSLKIYQELLEKTYSTNIPAIYDVYKAENSLSSRNKAEMDKFEDTLYEDMMKAVDKLREMGASEQEVRDYVVAKHGIERSIDFLVRDYFNEQAKAMRITKKEAEQELEAIKEKLKNDEITPMEADAMRQQVNTKRNTRKYTDEQITAMRTLYKEKRDALRKQLEAETITYEQFVDASIALAKKETGKELGDVAGLSSMAERLGKKSSEWLTNAREIVRNFEDKYNKAYSVDYLWHTINKCNDAVLKKLFDTGVISKEMYDKLSDQFLWYVPLSGFTEKVAEDVYSYIGNDTGAFTPPVKIAKGRTSESEDPFAIIGNKMQSAILQGNRNALKVKMLMLQRTFPTDLITESRMWEVKQPDGSWQVVNPEIPAEASAAEVDKIVSDFKRDMEELMKKGDARVHKSKANIPYKVTIKTHENQHEIVAYLAGQPITMYVNGNPQLAKALNGKLKATTNNIGLKAFDAINRWMSANKTSFNPDFMLPNVLRDLEQAVTLTLIDEGVADAAKLVANILPAFFEVIGQVTGVVDGTSQRSKYFEEFILNGGETGYSHINDLAEWKTRNRRRWERLSRWEKVASASVKPITFGVDVVSAFNRIFEDTTRFATYLTSRESGKNIAGSIWAAKSISTNFNKKGSGATEGIWGVMANFLRRWMLFFNPMVQGAYQHWDKFSKHKKAYLFVTTLNISFGYAVAALNSMNDDDEDEEMKYKNQNEYTRRNNIMIKTDKGYIKIPLAPIFREFYALGDILYSVTSGDISATQGAMAAFNTMRSIVSLEGQSSITGKNDEDFSIAKFILPQSLEFIGDIVDNKTFTGAPIYRNASWDKGKPEYQKVYNGTWKPLIKASKFLNDTLLEMENRNDDFLPEYREEKAARGSSIWMNPAIWQHSLESIMGGAGRTIINAIDVVAKMRNGEEIETSQIPVVSRFYQEPTERNRSRLLSNQYYDVLDLYDDYAGKVGNLTEQYSEANAAYQSAIKSLNTEDPIEIAKGIDEFLKTPEGERYSKIKNEYNRFTKSEQGKFYATIEQLIKDVNKTRKAVKDGQATQKDVEAKMREVVDLWKNHKLQISQPSDVENNEQQ